MTDKITSLIKKYSANVTVTASGNINLLNIIPSDRVPVFVQGSTGRLTNGTGADEYAPYIFNDPDVGATKVLTVYTVPRMGGNRISRKKVFSYINRQVISTSESFVYTGLSITIPANSFFQYTVNLSGLKVHP